MDEGYLLTSFSLILLSIKNALSARIVSCHFSHAEAEFNKMSFVVYEFSIQFFAS